MSVYKRGKHWYVRFTVNGQETTLSADDRTKTEAKAWEAELKKEKRAKARGVYVDIKITQAILECIQVGEPVDTAGNALKQPGEPYALEPSSWERLRVSFRQILRYLDHKDRRGTLLSAIDNGWLWEFIKWRRSGDGASNRTIRRDIDALSSMLERRAAAKLIARNPIKDFVRNILLPEKKTEIIVPSLKEIQLIIDTMHEMHGRFVAFQALTGLRQQEALKLKWHDIVLLRKRLIVNKSKIHLRREVLLFDEAIEILDRLPKPPNHLSDPKGGFVFWHLDKDGHATNYKRFANQWRSFVQSVPDLDRNIRDHDLRHFYAWLYLKKGGRLEGLMMQMGHLSVETTRQYSHMAAHLAEFDLTVMGYEVVTEPFDFSLQFSYEKCGGFLSPREAQARTRRIRAAIRANQPERQHGKSAAKVHNISAIVSGAETAAAE
jgi:integrase